MKQNMIKYIIGSLVIALTIHATLAQNVARTGYFMENSTHKHLMNPALVPTRGYFSYPGLGSVDIDLQSNLGFTNFIFPGLTETDPLLTFMHEDVTPEQFLSQLSPENYIKLNQRLSLVSLGFYAGTSFWTLEVASRINAKVNLPYDFFAFMKQGMSSPAGNNYAIRNLTVSSDMMAEASLGSSFRITDNIRLGVKGKLLVGGGKIIAGIDEMDIDMRPDGWTVTTNGLMNVYGAGLDLTTDENDVINGFLFSAPDMNMAGMGYALDLGASWKPTSFLEVSAGIIDLGSITWNKTYNKVARSSGTVNYTGFDNIGMTEEGEESPMDAQMKEMMDGMLEMAQFKIVDESDNLKESLVPTINAGIEAGVLNNKVSIGVLYSNRLIPNNNISEVTGIVNLKPFSGFNLAGSYSLMNGVQNTFGLAMGINLLIANVFIACDYIPMYVTPQYIPLNKATTHLQIGLSLSLWKMKKRK